MLNLPRVNVDFLNDDDSSRRERAATAIRLLMSGTISPTEAREMVDDTPRRPAEPPLPPPLRTYPSYAVEFVTKAGDIAAKIFFEAEAQKMVGALLAKVEEATSNGLIPKKQPDPQPKEPEVKLVRLQTRRAIEFE